MTNIDTHEIDFTAYHDLSQRFAVYSTDGGEKLRGESDDVAIVDAEPAMRSDEVELHRMFGLASLTGGFKEEGAADGTYALGGVAEGPAVFVITYRRLIVMVVEGITRLGTVEKGEEVHVFALPFDLVDSIQMRNKKKFGDRVAGNRPISVGCWSAMISLRIQPAYFEADDGSNAKLSDDDAFSWIVRAVIGDRLEKAPQSDHDRLSALGRGEYPVIDGVFEVDATPEFEGEVPPHLVGRVKVHV